LRNTEIALRLMRHILFLAVIGKSQQLLTT